MLEQGSCCITKRGFTVFALISLPAIFLSCFDNRSTSTIRTGNNIVHKTSARFSCGSFFCPGALFPAEKERGLKLRPTGPPPGVQTLSAARNPSKTSIPGKEEFWAWKKPKQLGARSFPPSASKLFRLSGTAEGIRTPDLLVRSQSLYPAELQPHIFLPPRLLLTTHIEYHIFLENARETFKIFALFAGGVPAVYGSTDKALPDYFPSISFSSSSIKVPISRN